ncbi:hypothetical protein [Pseudanabaena sp. FACHB-2040]|uniref:hypothetical protein n=1 Tax=Pseudanabaena sp. FACHB-2040 TaxID=2692859 RepID=UPI0016858D7B|nr:hypothetical protein [Pseudanabaena sp. FACHB-2040]MBD2256359.1 hypothetical protein [Pseudanabaena sp. FACHB-2040]
MLVKSKLLCLIGACVLTSVGVISVQSTTKPSQAVSTPVQAETPATQVNNLSQSIGEIEVEHAIALSRFPADTQVIEDLNRRRTALVSQLQQIEPQRYQALVRSASQSALSSKFGAIDVERTIALSRGQADTPAIQDLDRQSILLTARLKELQPQRYQALVRSASQSALSSKFGAIDVERTIALSRGQADTPIIQDLNRQSILLTARLKDLQPQRYLTLATSATRSALQLKITELEAEYQRQADASSRQTLRVTINSLRQRLTQLDAS